MGRSFRMSQTPHSMASKASGSKYHQPYGRPARMAARTRLAAPGASRWFTSRSSLAKKNTLAPSAIEKIIAANVAKVDSRPDESR